MPHTRLAILPLALAAIALLLSADAAHAQADARRRARLQPRRARPVRLAQPRRVLPGAGRRSPTVTVRPQRGRAATRSVHRHHRRALPRTHRRAVRARRSVVRAQRRAVRGHRRAVRAHRRAVGSTSRRPERVPVRSAPVRSGPVRSGPVRSAPVRSTPWRTGTGRGRASCDGDRITAPTTVSRTRHVLTGDEVRVARRAPVVVTERRSWPPVVRVTPLRHEGVAEAPALAPRGARSAGRTSGTGRRHRLAGPGATGRSATLPPAEDPAELLAARLHRHLQLADMEGALRVARWAAGDPRRERALQAALFARFPAPELLQQSIAALRSAARCQHPGARATLLRIFGGDPRPD